MANPYMIGLLDNVYIALTLFVLVWIFSWAKGAIGSPKLAILFALIVIYLTIYQYPELVWLGVILFFMSTLGKDFLGKIQLHQGRR